MSESSQDQPTHPKETEDELASVSAVNEEEMTPAHSCQDRPGFSGWYRPNVERSSTKLANRFKKLLEHHPELMEGAADKADDTTSKPKKVHYYVPLFVESESCQVKAESEQSSKARLQSTAKSESLDEEQTKKNIVSSNDQLTQVLIKLEDLEERIARIEKIVIEKRDDNRKIFSGILKIHAALQKRDLPQTSNETNV